MECIMESTLVDKITELWNLAKADSPLKQKSAVCISTIGDAGFPHSRFVDLKAVNENGFTFCTSYLSEKGLQLAQNDKVSLTAWWDHVGIQIRVVGHARRISDSLADQYWKTRNKEAQVATLCFNQSEVWNSDVSQLSHFQSALAKSPETIPRPKYWGGYHITPNTVEILQFKESRVHQRDLFTLNDEQTKSVILQP